LIVTGRIGACGNTNDGSDRLEPQASARCPRSRSRRRPRPCSQITAPVGDGATLDLERFEQVGGGQGLMLPHGSVMTTRHPRSTPSAVDAGPHVRCFRRGLRPPPRERESRPKPAGPGFARVRAASNR
jgi:hypothetical protein